MFRTTRLKKRAEFLEMAQKGMKVVKPGLIGQVLTVKDSPVLRSGFTVTKKVGNAVTRNRVKRRLREAFRLVANESDGLSGTVVLIGRNQTINRPFEKLKDDTRDVLRPLKERKGIRK